jgi:luciferase family oxidoreductase group 1
MPSKKIKLSILDQSPVRFRGTARQALLETVELIKFADAHGYSRFWVSEHHNTIGLAGSSPEVLIAHLAGETNRIKVGSGGVMLPNHSALKVAESFRTLEALFPGRIDLGIGRAPGTDRTTAALLNPSNIFSEKEFIQQIQDLNDFFNDTYQPGYDESQIIAIPVSETIPSMWILSSSGQSGAIAAEFGLGLSFAHFINPLNGPEMVRKYKERFKPSPTFKAPAASVAIFVVCAETEEKVTELQQTVDALMLLIEKRVRQGVLPWEEIRQFSYSLADMERIKYNRQRMIAGTPDKVKKKIEDLAELYGVDEVIAVTITYDFKDRLRSYELLAEQFELTKGQTS